MQPLPDFARQLFREILSKRDKNTFRKLQIEVADKFCLLESIVTRQEAIEIKKRSPDIISTSANIPMCTCFY